MKPGYVPGCMSLRAQKREAKHLGIEVTTVRRSGEVRFTCVAKCHLPIVANNRRTDGTTQIAMLLAAHRAAANTHT